jgi:hypothetical protein
VVGGTCRISWDKKGDWILGNWGMIVHEDEIPPPCHPLGDQKG